MLLEYDIHQIASYINWDYFFHAWGFQPRYAEIADIHGCDACRALWLASFPERERAKAIEAMQLFKEATRALHALDGHLKVYSLYRLCPANADGDDLIIYPYLGQDKEVRLPLLRQQSAPEGKPCLCLSDFVRPVSQGIRDTVGFFASSVDMPHVEDPYQSLLNQTLADRLAEAATEVMHLDVRKHAWGYAPDESLSVKELFKEKFQGIRPAVGYPSLPDQSINFIINPILDFKRIGITLTEHGAMHPHSSVCGMMIAHPASHYFSVGKIGEDQLNDYARRRGIGVEKLKKFLAGNLG